MSTPFSLLLAKRVVRNGNWRVAFRELAVVHCESWPACFIYIYFFCYHPTRQLKLNTHCIQNPLETNWSFTSTMFTLIIIVLFFCVCRQRRNVWFSFICTYQNLSWFIGKNCVILRFDIAVVLQTRQASLFISGRQKKLRLPTTQALKLNRVHKVNSLRLFQRSFARCNRNEVCHSLREGIIDTFLLSLSYV